MTASATRSWDGLMPVLRWTSMAVLVFMMVSICYDAIMRYAFAAPTSWSLEINSFLLVYLAVIGAAEAQRHDAHIRITFFKDKLPPRSRAAIDIVTGLLGVVFCAILVWRGGIMALQAYEYSERVSSSLGTPMVFPYALLPIGFATLGLQFLMDAARALPRLRHGLDEEVPHG
ncbi:TRAP transporter small permease [Halomonas sp. MCCC 1A17488]|uniref:TRAP transporter small permease n=1 Tax=unclassified Halomonas TaxID=2609666 RepID=UPI0018D266BF|nr:MULTISPECIES: TRAP transporter small permease [unclassified Halomonas]MCE8015775.1 TRAP transporter small permease [Halomonas sp. MCCC 1A17488]MCG3239108.1 TRAP transporter small permease [Halomonas sp. MCCC 1A17488]QPP50948.1 TRAP transporter small permease [Halomonas sp. SS10-MC5]